MTAHVKYVYLDIVGFTRQRSVEAQTDLVEALNAVIRAALDNVVPPGVERLLLPTGDGMAIALVRGASYDLHVSLAVEIQKTLALRNSTIEDPMRQFCVRIGVNENVDNLVTDINGAPNVAGHGIAMAQRIMDVADGGQVVVGQTVFETLHNRERYMNRFVPYNALGKHGVSFKVYQLQLECLNTDTPSAFGRSTQAEPRLSRVAAYFIAHAILNQPFLLSRNKDSVRKYVATVLLFSLAQDSIEEADVGAHREPTKHTWSGNGKSSFEEAYKHYWTIDFWPMTWLTRYLIQDHLSEALDCFIEVPIVNSSALTRLRNEWPALAAEFNLAE